MILTAFYEAIEAKAAETIKKDQSDYEVNGLLYCGKCHTPKQARVKVLGMVRTPMCLCKCEKEKRDAAEAKRKQREYMDEIKRMRSVGFPDSDMEKWSFNKDDQSNEKISTIAHRYVDNFDEMLSRGKGLLFYGQVGTGKTFISACIANALIDKGHPCLVTNFA